MIRGWRSLNPAGSESGFSSRRSVDLEGACRVAVYGDAHRHRVVGQQLFDLLGPLHQTQVSRVEILLVTEVEGFPQVVDAVSIPVIAAGGIGDGRGIAAAFMLGAEAVQMGTRFVVAKESIVHENYKQRIIKAKDIDSAVTGRTHGHPVRCLRNQMTREYNRLEAEGKSFEELEYLTLGTLRKAVQEGDTTNGTVMAGQIAGLVTKEQTCKEMIDEMMEQADKLLGGCQK